LLGTETDKNKNKKTNKIRPVMQIQNQVILVRCYSTRFCE